MDYKKLHLYLYTFCRYFIATIIISYAFAKLLETQFITQPSVYDKPISSLSGFQLTWYYYGYSFWYGAIIAFIQITTSLLLFFRKTTRIGILLFLTFMLNILMIDFAYDIDGAKGMAVILTIMGLFIFLSDYKIFIKLLIQSPSLFADETMSKKYIRLSKLKYIYIPVIFIGIFVLLNTLKQNYLGKDELTGTWENIENKERLYFEAAKSYQRLENCKTTNYENGTYKLEGNQLILKTEKKKDVSAIFTIKDNILTISEDEKAFVYKRIR